MGKTTTAWFQDDNIYGNFKADGRTFFLFVELPGEGLPEFDLEYMYEPGSNDVIWRRWRFADDNDAIDDPDRAIAEFNKCMSDRGSPVSLRVDQAIEKHIRTNK